MSPFSSVALLATGSASSSSLFVTSGFIAGVPTSPSFPFTIDPWLAMDACIHGRGPYPFHGGWPQLCFPSRECPRCATHLAIMPLEPLIIIFDSSASSATLVFVHFRGNIPYTNKPFWDCWYPLLSSVASQGKVMWCGHQCALPTTWSHRREFMWLLETSVPVHINDVQLTGLQRYYS